MLSIQYILGDELPMIIVDIIVGGYFPVDFYRIAERNNVGGDIFGHHGTCANDRVVPDMYAGKDCDIGANPYIFADKDRLIASISICPQ